ncbi:MAG: flagellar protein FlaG [Marinobacter sp.]|uniref:flagellar protein FlaG n=1 Tax=Marinobacter sp. TaxID=50741 RepID=UPI0029C34B41|nr:flagellar protein FlaG [Marinobacter sp.]MDX5385836.1 flagellar protein FlaG [Marinobacter sp.]
MKEVITQQITVGMAGSTASQASGNRPAAREVVSLPGTQATGGNPSPREGQGVSAEQVSQAVSDLNDYVQSVGRDLQFQVDEDSGRSIIRVLDSQTQEVIRQIPSEEALALARTLSQTESLSSMGFKVEA